MDPEQCLENTSATLRAAGCVSAEEEAAELIAACGGDDQLLGELVGRRSTGEPLAWLVGSVSFCTVPIQITKGVYVPRWQTEALALEAVARLPERGLAVDLCTGSGAVAAVLSHYRPQARVIGSEIDPVAAACARSNGVEVYQGDMGAGLPASIWRQVDVVTAVVPYVPTGELQFLPRDVTAYEPTRALDGGSEGTEQLVRACQLSGSLLKSGGSLLVELGGRQDLLLKPFLCDLDFHDFESHHDEDGDLRAVFCRR